MSRPDKAERNKARCTTHGLRYHKRYRIWNDMMTRCYNTNSKWYSDYGGRGIKVCDDWKIIANFISWVESLEPIPPKFSIDRIDVNGNYEPSNCRFISSFEQNRNMRSNIVIEYQGEKFILKDFVSKYGVVSYDTASKRISKRGWNPIDAALTPSTPRNMRKKACQKSK